MNTKKVPFWLVWNSNGYPPNYRHETRQSAELEAERLARLTPGARFYVLMPIAEIIRVDITSTYFIETDDIPF